VEIEGQSRISLVGCCACLVGWWNRVMEGGGGGTVGKEGGCGRWSMEWLVWVVVWFIEDIIKYNKRNNI
jgi:hypothetical protein